MKQTLYSVAAVLNWSRQDVAARVCGGVRAYPTITQLAKEAVHLGCLRNIASQTKIQIPNEDSRALAIQTNFVLSCSSAELA
jgi:hypothetical protein